MAPLQQISLGSGVNTGDGDSPRAAGAKINANWLLLDALRTAIGLADGVEQLGLPATITGSNASAAADTLLVRLAKLQDRIEDVEGATPGTPSTTRHAGDTTRTDRVLAPDYDYRGTDEALMGTTLITSAAQATALGYPDGPGVYQIQSSLSGAVTGSAVGRFRTVILTSATRTVIVRRIDGTWEVADDVTESDAVFTRDAAADWGTAAGGLYTLTVPEASHGFGANVSVDAWDLSSVPGSRVTYVGFRIEDATGDIIFQAQEAPDSRVALRIVVRPNA